MPTGCQVEIDTEAVAEGQVEVPVESVIVSAIQRENTDLSRTLVAKRSDGNGHQEGRIVMRCRRLFLSGAILLGGAWCASLAAQPGNPTSGASAAKADSPATKADETGAGAGKKGKPRPKPAAGPHEATFITPAREAAALTFARLHHPELADLLEQLKQSNPPAYKRALQDLYETSERLARLQAKGTEQHVLAIEAWRIDSQIRLLSARYAMTGDETLGKQLKLLLRQRIDVRRRELELERRQVEARLARIDEDLREIAGDPQSAVDQDFADLVERLGRLNLKPGRPARNDPKSDRGPPSSTQDVSTKPASPSDKPAPANDNPVGIRKSGPVAPLESNGPSPAKSRSGPQ